MRRLLAVVALCSALGVGLSGAGVPFAIPFFELEELQVSGVVAAGRFGSLIDQQSLYAIRLTDGMPLVRIDNVGPAPFDLDGGRLVYAHPASRRVISVDLASNHHDELWKIPEESRIAAIHLSGQSVLLVVEDSGGTHALWSEDGNAWSDIELADRLQIKALVRNRLVATDRSAPGRLFGAALTNAGTGAWTTLYESASSGIDLVRPIREATAVTFLERESPESALAIVRVPIDAAGPPQRTVLPAVSPAAPIAWSADYLAWPERHDGRLFLNAFALTAAPTSPATLTGPARAATHHRGLEPSAERSVAWLERQLSAPFVSRHGRPARLIDSYEDGQRAGWIYDAAVASIAFVAVGETGLASELLAGVEHLQRSDGSWVSSFDPDTRLARGSDRYVGAMAWVVMAVNFFESDTGDPRFAPMARRGLLYLERYRITEARSDMRGAFRMGPSRPTVISTEHNVDCYSAFLWRGRLEDNLRDLVIAEGVRDVIVRRLWLDRATTDGHFRVGAGADGVFLDAQTWTTLALNGPQVDARLAQALRSAERVLEVDDGRLGAVKGIVGFDESDASAPEKVWAEGSEGMVAALLALGETDRARRYHAETARYQRASGGIPYATENDAKWTSAPSVAATGWYVLNSLNPARNPFHPSAW